MLHRFKSSFPRRSQLTFARRTAGGLVIATVASLSLLMGGSRPARAQGYTPIYVLDYGNPVVIGGDGSSTTAGRGRSRFALATGFFPYANFYRSGYLPERQGGGTEQIAGQLLALDGSLVPSTMRGIPVDVGGWYFGENNNLSFRSYRNKYDLYELHARAYTSARRELGFQAAVLQSTKANFPGRQYTYFVVSEYSSARLRRRRTRPWAVQGGVGLLVDPNYDPTALRARTTTDPTFFASGSLDLGNRTNLTISDWYVRDRAQDINRVALGVGYRF